MVSSRVFHLGSAVLLAVSVTIVAGCSRAEPTCAACGRQECRNMSVTLVREDGTRQETCCARCAAHVAATGPRVTSMTVRDFGDATELDASQAVFVEGSDVHPCRGVVTQPPLDERGCCLRPAFDRCEPSLIAFRDRGRALTFAREHGGIVRSFAELDPTLRAAAGS
jgi:hypothetical protein